MTARVYYHPETVPVNGVEQCINQNQQAIEKSIESSSQKARGMGISGTPGSTIYNRQSEQARKIVGAQPYDQFESAIKQVKRMKGYSSEGLPWCKSPSRYEGSKISL